MRQELRREFPEADNDTLSAAIARSGGYLGQAKTLLEAGSSLSAQTEGFLKSFADRDSLGLVQTLVPMERWKREQLLEELNQWTELLQNALFCRSGMPTLFVQARNLSIARSSPELLKAIGHLQKAIQYTQGNVSAAAVCGYLEWALR